MKSKLTRAVQIVLHIRVHIFTIRVLWFVYSLLVLMFIFHTVDADMLLQI